MSAETRDFVRIVLSSLTAVIARKNAASCGLELVSNKPAETERFSVAINMQFVFARKVMRFAKWGKIVIRKWTSFASESFQQIY